MCKGLFLVIAIMIVLSGCHSKLIPINTYTYEIGQIKEATVGSSMIEQEKQDVVQTTRWVGLAFSSTGYEQRIRKFTQQLIYGGRLESMIKVSYREYVDGIARSGFYQDLQYDLRESNEIAFKNLRILILDANNTRVKFKVISD